MNITGNIMELNNNNFTSTIQNGITLVDFWAVWCMPCKMQTPILEVVANNLGTKAKITKLNVDDYPDIAGEYGVMSIPTLILFKDGKLIKQFVGVQNERTLTDAINSAL